MPSVLAATVLAVSLAPAWTIAGATATPSTTRPVVVGRAQELALLLAPHTAMSAPDDHAVALDLVTARRPITAERTALPVIGRKTDADRVKWLHVRLPGRPNGHTGWIHQRATSAAVTSWHIIIDTAMRRVTVYRTGRPVRTFKAIVGKPSTPTPAGEFFIEEAIQLRPNDIGAPFALALSARSNALLEYAGGPGQIGVHGLANIGGILGSAVSHGCVRLDNAAMRWLVARVGPGVPVTITS